MIFKSPAIIFKSIDFKESSEIVTAFTREHGKLALMVHGAKKPKKRISGLIEVGHILEIVYYYKSSRSVQTLKEASYLVKTPALRENFEKMALMTISIELIDQLLQEGEVNDELFGFTRNFLEWLNETEAEVRKVFPYVQLRLCEIMGVGIQTVSDPEDKREAWFLNIENGTVLPERETSHNYDLTGNQVNYIKLALNARTSTLFKVPFSNSELKQLIDYLDNYLKYHLEGIKDRTSDAIFEQILQE